MNTKTSRRLKCKNTKRAESKHRQSIYAKWSVWGLTPVILVLLSFGILSVVSQGTIAQLGKIEIDTISLDQYATTATPELTPETEVLVYVGEGDWKPMLFKELVRGQEFQFDNHLCYIDQNGLIRMNPDVDVALLHEADRIYDKNNSRFPKSTDVVRFIGEDNKHLRHDFMGTLQAKDQFFFQGRLYEAVADQNSPTGSSLRKTDIVLSRVTETFKRQADTLIDLTIVDKSGKESIISGTPEHPFYVPLAGDYIAMGKIQPDTTLKTDDGSIATVKSSKIRKGDFTVYNLEVEGTHNYFVSPIDGGPVVNVHNDYCKTSPPLPRLDKSGKIHTKPGRFKGPEDLPRVQDLKRYPRKDLIRFWNDLQESVKQRVIENSKNPYHRSHGNRQATEQQLMKSIEKILGK